MKHCCERMRQAVLDDLIRQTDAYQNMHLTPPAEGCADPSINYCPFCGRGQRASIREQQDRERALLDAHTDDVRGTLETRDFEVDGLPVSGREIVSDKVSWSASDLEQIASLDVNQTTNLGVGGPVLTVKVRRIS